MATYLYVSLQGDDVIARYDLDQATGGLSNRSEFALAGMPAPMATDPDKSFLFVGRRRAGEYGLTSFSIDGASGDLTRINDINLGGNPVHVSVDRTGKYLLSAYYYQARVGVHGFGDDGRLDPTPIEWREAGIGAHYIQTDASNRYAFVPHIAEGSQTGPNAIFQYRFDETSGRLTPNTPDRANPTSPEGPRHVCFNPNLDVVYSSNEQGCSVTAYRFDAGAGTLSPFQTAPTLPEDFTERNTCSQIQITPSGRFLYAPNRGHNSVAGFAVDADDGSLTAIGRVATEAVPRAFSLDITGSYLYASGLDTGRLASYRVNPDSGELEPLDVYDIGREPMWVLVVDL